MVLGLSPSPTRLNSKPSGLFKEDWAVGSGSGLPSVLGLKDISLPTGG